LNSAKFGVEKHREDVGRSNLTIPMTLPAAGQTAVNPARWLTTGAAGGAGLGSVALVLQYDLHPCCLCFVGDVLPQTTVRPLADFLLALGVQSLAVGNVAHIADDDGPSLLLDGEIDDRPTDLVADVADFPLCVAFEVVLEALQSPPHTASFLTSSLERREDGQLLVAILDGSPQFPGRKHNRLRGRGRNRWMDFAKVYGHHIIARWRGRLFAVIYDNVPVVPLALVIVDKPGFFEAGFGEVSEAIPQSDTHRLKPPGLCQEHLALTDSDSCAFPNGGSEAPSLVGEPSLAPRFSERIDCLDRFVERLLRGVPAVGVENGWSQGVVEPFGVALPEPVTRTPIETPVPGEDQVVDATRFTVKLVEQALGLFRFEDMCPDHPNTHYRLACRLCPAR